MSGLHIDQDKCQGCGLCLNSCANGALSLESDLACLDADKCTLCGVCAEACPFEALSLVKEERDLHADQYRGLWVFAEQAQGQLLPVGPELLGQGRVLAGQLGCALTAVLCGHDVETQAQQLIAAGADRVLMADHPAYARPEEELYCDLLAQLVAREKPEILLFGATGFGRSLAPRLAARLQTGLTADCTQLNIDPETRLLQQTRPAFGGNLMATIICPQHRPQMATVRPGVMPAPQPDYQRQGEIVRLPAPDHTQAAIRLLRQVQKSAGSIAEAEIIVSAGRGLGQQKNMALVRELAELLGGEVGCSRPLVDMGWCEYKHQVGQTGCSVAPKLLIACGISGAIQHLIGIGNAKTIIAINNDPDAPIFRVAQYKIVGDCVPVLKEMIAQLKAEPV